MTSPASGSTVSGTTVVSAGGVADDHLSLRAAPDGRLFLVAKDSIGTGYLHLYVRGVNGPWGQKTMVDSEPQAQPTRPTLELDVENDSAYVIYHNSTDKKIYIARSSMSSPGFAPRCVFLSQGNNVTSTKQNVTASTGLIAAASVGGQIYSGRFELGSAATSATFSAVPERMAARTDRALARDAKGPHGPLRMGAGNDVAASAAEASLLDGAPVAGFEVIWAGRLSTSETPVDDSQWWWLRGQGVNTIVNLDAVMYDFAQYGFESFLWLPTGAGKAPTDETANSFLKFIQSCDNEPAHISGGARDGRATLVALLRYAIDGWTLEAALAEGERLNGGVPLSPEQITWLRGWAASHPPGSERIDSCLVL